MANKKVKRKKKAQKGTKRSVANKQKLFIDTYLTNFGNITLACQKANIGRRTFYNWCKENKFKDMLEAAIEQHNDVISQKIYSMAAEGDKDLLKFWAKTQMKHRGFIEVHRLEHSGELDLPVKININIPKEVKKHLEEPKDI